MSYTTAQIAEALGIKTQSVDYRVKKEGWPFRKRPGKGGGRVFTLDALPSDVRAALVAREAKQAICTAETTALAVATSAPVRCRSLAPAVPALAPRVLDIPRKRKAMLRADLVRYYTDAVSRSANKAHARDGFIQAYLAGAYPELLREIGPVSWKTLERWKVTLTRTADAFHLADRRGLALRGQSSLTEAMQQAVLRLALHPNRVRLSTCISMTQQLLAAQGQDVPSDATFRRFLTTFQERNQDVWVFCREGVKAWNDKVAMYVDRDLGMLWPGAVLVADGHRLNFQIIHPFTGRPCRMTLVMWYDMASNYPVGWEIAPEENTLVITAAMRRALLRLGKPAQVAYLDNGRAFKGTHFTGDLSQSGVDGLFTRLGMKTTFAWAYHGQSKTVERFFGYLRQLEELMPGGTGSCIDLKPAYQKRGEFAHRAIWEASGSPVMTLPEAHRAVASWVDYYVEQPQPRSHLQGRCPREVFDAGRGDGLSAEHLDGLRECMLTARSRQVSRCQVSLPGSLVGSAKEITYFDSRLYGRKHDVIVKYDPQDLTSVDVYELDGSFICAAQLKAKVNPMAKVLGSDDDQRLLKLSLEMRKHAEKMASATATELLTGEIMPGYAASLERIGLTGGAAQGESPAAQPVPGRPTAPVLPTTDDDFAAELAELQAMNQPAPDPEPEAAEPDWQSYAISAADQFWTDVRGTYPEEDRYEMLLDAEAQGMLIPAEFSAFMRYFEQTARYGQLSGYFEEFRMKLALLHAVPATEAQAHS
jgi:putative transposase